MKKITLLTLILFACSIYIYSQSITVDSPKKGENWKLGTLKKIKWTATNTTEKFKITLWLDGVMVGLIANNVESDKRTLLWEVGNFELPIRIRPADLYSIKVKEKGTSTTGMSEIFKITKKVTEK